MKSNVFLIIEFILTAFILFFLLNRITPNFYIDVSGFLEEDIYASLISLNYYNFSNFDELKETVCITIKELVSSYEVYVNNSLACGENREEHKKSIKSFYILNGEIVEVYIRFK